MTPEAKARREIDRRLIQSGWTIQDLGSMNLGTAIAVAVREYPTDTGPADYVLFVDRKPVGIIEAKAAATILTFVEEQTARYAASKLKWFIDHKPLPFLFESTGAVTRFTDTRDPAPCSREIFQFFRPETLKAWIDEGASLRTRLRCEFVPLLPERLRDCQFKAVQGLEASFTDAHKRALIQMATGAGKTYTAITAAYRLLRYAKAKRILFLVDTRNLGVQAHQEFTAYTPPDDPRHFTELYPVQRVGSAGIDPAAKVCICTIQRLYSLLKGEPLDDSAEDISPAEYRPTDLKPRPVVYSPSIPVEAFDFIVIDECHRSIYNLWKQVLDYFDAFLIGLTATPDKRTFGFFNENLVSEYSYEQSVADGVNVPYSEYLIETAITRMGAKVDAGEWVDRRDRLTRQKRWQQQDEDEEYTGKELDRSVVNTSQIRNVIQGMKRAVETELFPRRKEVPKTLIFAKTDSHADDIIQTVRDVYGAGNAFCKKVTYGVKDEDPQSVLSQFRNEYNPRIAVTVDMIATGTDVKPIEVLLFMRDVRSKNYYEQMKGRGVRSLDFDDLRKVTPSAEYAKEGFWLIDAVGVTQSIKTDSRPIERLPQVPLKDLLQNIAVGTRNDDTVLSLANRLLRLDKRLDDKARARIAQQSGGIALAELARSLVLAVDPDKTAAEAKRHYSLASENDASSEQLQAARDALVATACQPFDNPDLRQIIEAVRVEREQLIDTINLDHMVFQGFSADAETKAEQVIASFKAFIEANKEEIDALGFFYAQPYQRRALTFDMVEELHEALARPPLMLTNEKLWSAYQRVQQSQVKGANLKRRLTDIVALVRFALGMDGELRPFAEQVDSRFKDWIFRHNARRGQAFTEEQTAWLRLIKDHIAANCAVERPDLDYAPFADRGGLARAWKVFGSELDELMDEMNRELVA